MSPQFYDSHNHLQDSALSEVRSRFLTEAASRNIRRIVVNGTQEKDWPEVLSLARASTLVVPSFGLHPWFIASRSKEWKDILLRHLDAIPSAIGEIGLDRWIEGFDLPQQEEVFLWQWRLAVERNLPVSIHCLKAWGRLLELLQAEPAPRCGFLLHSYGGPREMIEPLATLGAYFSISGYFAHERKNRQREVFLHVPPGRLLIETDAPDMLPPEKLISQPLTDPASGKPANHPANISAIYQFVADLFNEPLPTLASRVEANFLRLFGSVLR